ncbi:MAG TPA: Gfo/Idh/MocA family oxidoreductase [Armatimonadota bacterium]|jgi:predicted dehydrogenase
MIRFNHEYPPEERLRVGYLGCGDHSFRNVLPCFRYAPVELVATCDRQEERAAAFARQFGAQRYFTDYEQMLQQCDLDAVFIVIGAGEQGYPYAPLAMQALEAGCQVFTEKPPANSVAEVEQVRAAEQRTGKFWMVGCKKAFFPAVARAREISQRPEFGRLNSVYARYPQSLPLTRADRQDPQKMRGFLDHLVHPASLLYSVGGEMTSVRFSLDPAGGSTSVIRFAGGALGTLHLVAGISGTSPLERLEIVGEGENVVVDNGTRLTYYRRGGRGEGGYGRAGDFLGPDESAPLLWEPEFSLGQLYNSGLFLLGYAPEVLYFCRCVQEGRRPDLANSDWALALMRLYEAYQGPEDEAIPLG